jgi:cardiolipin synthase (CMP-forming)
MWLANLLTLSRIPLGILVLALPGRPRLLLAIITVAALTDVIDGPIARAVKRRHQVPDDRAHAGFGAWLDPLCDKFFVISVLLATYMAVRPPALILAAIATREIVLVPVAAVYRFTSLIRRRLSYDFRAGPIGKLTTVIQFLAVAALLTGHSWSHGLAVVAGVAGLLAGTHYIIRGFRLAQQEP